MHIQLNLIRLVIVIVLSDFTFIIVIFGIIVIDSHLCSIGRNQS